MSYTSPLAIVVYLILAILFVTTMLRRLTKEKFIVAMMRSSPQHRKRVIGSYRKIVKMYTILIVVYCVLIPTFTYLHFGPENGEGILLAAAGLFILLIIKAIEDIQYRNHVIVRLENEHAASQHVGAASVSQEAFEAKVRKWKTIVFVILIVVMFATIIAFYYTMGGPWWIYVVALVICFLTVALGFWIEHKQEQ
jgi:hypothetical protein